MNETRTFRERGDVHAHLTTMHHLEPDRADRMADAAAEQGVATWLAGGISVTYDFRAGTYEVETFDPGVWAGPGYYERLAAAGGSTREVSS